MIWLFFVITLVIEAPVVLYAFRKELKKAVFPFLLLNFFTWSLLHLLLVETTMDANWLEAGVALTEAVGYKLFMRCSWTKALVIAVIANGLSYGAGLLISHFFN